MAEKENKTPRINDEDVEDSATQVSNGQEPAVLTQSIPSITRSIAEAVVVKNEEMFFLTRPDGCIPMEGKHGFGLFYHDCRYLNGYELKLADTSLTPLVSNAAAGFSAVFELVNPEIELEGDRHITRDQISLKWERMIDAGELTLYDKISIQNFGRQRVAFPLSLSFRCKFEDIFAIRGLLPKELGELYPPSWKDGMLSFVYAGADGVNRGLSIHFLPEPDELDATQAYFNFDLETREQKEVLASLVIAESEEDVQPQAHQEPDLKKIEAYFRDESDNWLAGQTKITSDSLVLNSILDRSLRDLRMLRDSLDDDEFFSAGVPWFATLFGRDSLITGLQTLAFNRETAAETLRLLAKYQGQEVNDYRDEQPGKILHELRVGELARLKEIPHTPYYGTVDATPLFLFLLAQHADWSGDLSLFEELRDNVERALDWMANYGDADGDGYLEYENKSRHGLVNQGWKDSDQSIVNADGSLATPPISLVEVQGYVYLAKKGLANLFARSGDEDKAEALREEAKQLYEKFNQDFWLDDLGFYALALQAGDRPAAVVSSNPGQALWAGIIDPDKCEQTVKRLMAADMFNGWGIRTLSADNQCYNPTGYHVGTVWPHDNSMILAGFRKYSFDEEALQIFNGIVEAAMDFDHYRLPEVFAGFNREDYNVPVRYPVACHPQAWSAGSVPYMVTTLLGLKGDAFNQQLHVIRPILPDFVDRIQVRNLKVGKGSADIDFERSGQDACAVEVIRVEGELEVVVETQAD
ncbi:MAG TPA: glycogen debranching N-terminal domain-containing protein [Anaerolineales bacterium]|nr:glycogen debranching N-terminal domain-containing protein [Anaerolineales bacterium]